MKHTVKKIMTIGVIFTLIFTSVFTTASLIANASTSVSWNFSDTSFRSLGTFSTSQTINGLTLIATSDKTMSVAANSQTVSGVSFSYALSLGGSGTTSYRSIKVPVSGSDTIKVTCMSSGTSARTLAIANSSGTVLGNLTAGTTASTQSYSYSGASGYVYIYSTNSNINIFKVQVDSNSTTTTSSTTPTTTTSGSTTGTTVTSYSALLTAITAAEKNGGGTVYVKGTNISCTGQVLLAAANSKVTIEGVKNSDGTYPVLDFSSFRSGYIGKATSDAQVGIRITGSYYTLKNLIIQKAPDNGIQIKGTSAGNNTVYNCITRYNNDAGLQITGGAYSNAIKFVYSYRNCDVYTLGGNSDGFAPKLGAGTGNSFYGCYAWENSDDGWDSYDKDSLTLNLSYEQSACWNNGDPTIFTGQYDFNKGNALDSNLLLVELIKAKDSTFATKYASGTFALPTSSFIATSSGTLTPAGWVSNYGGNSNGFKFGSAYSTSSCVRTVKNCLTFGHKSKGFDNNNSACTAALTNCVAFDNGYNYYIAPFKLTTFSNIRSFSGGSSDKLPSGYSTTVPSSTVQSTIRSTVNSTVNSITSKCKSNIIPGEVYFNIYN